ncbi:MAG TPA: DUF4255 domain-containing protein [Actinomycetota bacterium]|nr:DUF4255 domain-containing protein [Actinomycetota bacterium]
MLEAVGGALRALIERDALHGSGVDVSFEAPSKAWAARRNSPTVNVYLYDIREDLERRPGGYEEIRRPVDGREVVVDRRMPPRLFALSYLVSAWTQRPEDEHRLLGALLSCLLRNPVLPSGLGAPLRMTVGLGKSKDRSATELWAALGGELKPSLDVVVTAPVDPAMHQEVGPLVTEEPVVRVHDRTARS